MLEFMLSVLAFLAIETSSDVDSIK